jgi:DNA-binding cell septation regulator SpoVG
VEHVYAVRRVKEFQDGHIVFDLDIDDVTVYGCRVVAGKHGDFVGWPSREGKDGKFYSYVYLALTEDEQDAIIELVGKALADE